MIWFYRLVFLPALLVLLPGILSRMLRRGGLRENFDQRLGAAPDLGPPPPGMKRIWVHAVSVGEILAIAPVLERLTADPCIQIFLTTTTTTGYAVGRDRYAASGVRIGYFPLDFWPFSARAWRRTRPDLMILTESELWPEHLFQARRRRVPVLLINARMSDRSLSRLRKMSGLVRPLLRGIRRISVASEIDATRFREIALPGATVEHAGNLKLDVALGTPLGAAARERLRAELGLPDGMLLMGSSTWPGEEAALARALLMARSRGLACRLLLVPRHAERRDEILAELEKHPLRIHLRTRGAAPSAVDVCVADTTGEMVRLLQLAEVVFVGRSLAPHDGGQTPVEAAALGRAILFGPNMTNFRAIAQGLVETGGARVVADADALAHAALELLENPDLREHMATRASEWHAANRGAVDHTIALIRDSLARDAPGL